MSHPTQIQGQTSQQQPEEVIQPSRARYQLSVKSAGATDRGRVRETNQDQFLIAGLTSALRIEESSLPQAQIWYANENGHLLVVADGMGGARGGEQASALVVSTIEEFLLGALRWLYALREPEGDTILTQLKGALRRADARIFEEVRRRPELRGMGTTLTMAYSLAGELFIAHVGDSRCYLLRGGALYQLTRDHTVVAELVQRGLITPEQVPENRFRHIITNVVGGDSPGLKVEVHKLLLAPGDVLLLCSDGLTEMVSDQEIAEILSAQPEPRKACEQLIARANELGGHDNVTAIVARHDFLG
ncbi:MAG: PP2C family serine/threonine-protein phosphatase [Byssovorax sp.]